MELNFVAADTKERLAQIEEIYMEAFPENERKPFSMLVDAQAKGKVEILMIEPVGAEPGKTENRREPGEIEDGGKESAKSGKIESGGKDPVKSGTCAVGEVILAQYADVVLLDYFAVNPALRGRGIGGQILQKLRERCEGKRLLLEIESTKVESENAGQRLSRKRFYERCGMRPLDYSVDVLGVEMEVLTFGCEVGFEEYRAVYKEVYGAELAAHIRLAGGAGHV